MRPSARSSPTFHCFAIGAEDKELAPAAPTITIYGGAIVSWLRSSKQGGCPLSAVGRIGETAVLRVLMVFSWQSYGNISKRLFMCSVRSELWSDKWWIIGDVASRESRLRLLELQVRRCCTMHSYRIVWETWAGIGAVLDACETHVARPMGSFHEGRVDPEPCPATHGQESRVLSGLQ